MNRNWTLVGRQSAFQFFRIAVRACGCVVSLLLWFPRLVSATPPESPSRMNATHGPTIQIVLTESRVGATRSGRGFHRKAKHKPGKVVFVDASGRVIREMPEATSEVVEGGAIHRKTQVSLSAQKGLAIESEMDFVWRSGRDWHLRSSQVRIYNALGAEVFALASSGEWRALDVPGVFRDRYIFVSEYFENSAMGEDADVYLEDPPATVNRHGVARIYRLSDGRLIFERIGDEQEALNLGCSPNGEWVTVFGGLSNDQLHGGTGEYMDILNLVNGRKKTIKGDDALKLRFHGICNDGVIHGIEGGMSYSVERGWERDPSGPRTHCPD